MLGPRSRLGPYEIVSLLGAGGMGEVYKAIDTRLARTVAIKVLPAHVSANPDRESRFEREARTIASLAHPHICALHDVGHQDGIAYLVLEFLEGRTLAHRLEEESLQPREALTIATQIAEALAEAHRLGIVHRDLKPANVMLTPSGAKLLDFGLSVERPSADPAVSALETRLQLTTEGMVLGTFDYMAPEQMQGLPVGPAADVFAFGCVFFEMLTA